MAHPSWRAITAVYKGGGLPSKPASLYCPLQGNKLPGLQPLQACDETSSLACHLYSRVMVLGRWLDPQSF